jgi:hypothetical protein
MSASASTATIAVPISTKKARHAQRLALAYIVAMALIIGLIAYGFDYYTLSAVQRPLSAKHALLKPSGTIGLKLGILGLFMFLAIFLYPIRKRWQWLASKGSSKHWLDVHVLLGLSAPVIIAFHASFKFSGVAGMAFWIMSAVAISGIVGRYLYAQIPRSLSAAEMSLKELQELQGQLTKRIAAQTLISADDLQPLFRLPTIEQVQQWPAVFALIYMLALDLVRPFHIARLRLRIANLSSALRSFGGLLPTSHSELEEVVKAARQQAALSKRIVFLGRTQRIFHLWHVVHRPFSYSFAVLACIHIGVVFLLGYM